MQVGRGRALGSIRGHWLRWHRQGEGVERAKRSVPTSVTGSAKDFRRRKLGAMVRQRSRGRASGQKVLKGVWSTGQRGSAPRGSTGRLGRSCEKAKQVSEFCDKGHRLARFQRHATSVCKTRHCMIHDGTVIRSDRTSTLTATGQRTRHDRKHRLGPKMRGPVLAGQLTARGRPSHAGHT